MNNLDNTKNSAFALSEGWVEEIRQGDFVLTVEEDKETEESFSINSWDTLLGIPSEELDLEDLALDPCGHSLQWKDTLD